MKHFVLNNWYKLMMGFAAFLFSFGFLVFALKYNTAQAGIPQAKSIGAANPMQDNSYIVESGGDVYKVMPDQNALFDRPGCRVEWIGSIPER